MKHKFSAKALSLILSIVLMLSCFPVAMAKEEAKTFSLATINDIHYYPECLAGDKEDAFYTYLTGHNCIYYDLDAILDAALSSLSYEVKNNGIKYIAIAGDLTTNGEYEGHKALAKKLLDFEKKTGAKILVTPGNHDINNPRASQFTNDNQKEEARITTPAEFYEIYKELGFSDAYHKFSDFTKGNYGSLSYSVKTEDGYRIILADGGKFTPDITESGEAKQETSGTFTPELLEWVLNEAKDAKKNKEIPLLITHWNMSGANYFHEFLMQGFVIDDSYILQETLADAGINYSFGGHQHISDVAVTYSDSGNPMYSVITPTLTQFPFSYRVTDFTKNSKGGLDVTFNQKDCDEYADVKSADGDGVYAGPYKTTGFYKQFGSLDATEYVFGLLKSTLDKYFNGIRAEGSIVKYIEKELGIDIEETVNSYLLGGIAYDGTDYLSGKNVMSFLGDLDAQLMEKYFYNKYETYDLIKSALSNLLSTEVSSVPCTKFIDTYGFGDASHGGTLGDAVFSVLATMYPGNEDISDDLFLQDIVEFSGTPEFLQLLIDIIKKYVVDDLVVNNILASIRINLDTLFLGEAEKLGDYVQIIFAVLVNALDIRVNPEEALIQLSQVHINANDITLKKIVEAVLATGLIPYGSTIDELVDGILEMFITEDTREAATYQAKIVIGSMVTDNTKDYDVTYKNNGAVKVIPTKEDMQLPVNVTITPAEDNSDAFTISWITKYSVTGTDITLYGKNGKMVNDCEITKTTEEAEYTAPGFDAGTFGLFPWTHKIQKHTVTVKGLDADTEYKYVIGDKAKNFLTEGSIKTAPASDKPFTFIHISDTKGYIPSHFENFTKSLNKADSLYKDIRFMAYTGSLTGAPANDDMWSFGISAGEDFFVGKMTAFAAGKLDSEEISAQNKYFPVAHAPGQLTDTGLYYSFNYGAAHVAVINVNDLSAGAALSKEQAQWLRNDLSSSGRNIKIIITGEIDASTEESTALIAQIESIAKENGVNLIISGNRYTTIKANGVFYKEAADSLFSAITVNNNDIEITTYTTDGKPADSSSDAVKTAKAASGDIDLDSSVTSADARLALRSAVDLEALKGLSRLVADMDKDGKITAEDARLILRTSVGLENLF